MRPASIPISSFFSSWNDFHTVSSQLSVTPPPAHRYTISTTWSTLPHKSSNLSVRLANRLGSRSLEPPPPCSFVSFRRCYQITGDCLRVLQRVSAPPCPLFLPEVSAPTSVEPTWLCIFRVYKEYLLLFWRACSCLLPSWPWEFHVKKITIYRCSYF